MEWQGSGRALGAMSGTSLDGVDAAVIETDGERILGFGESGYRPYSDEEWATLHDALGKWPGDDGLEAALEVVQSAHAELLGEFDAAAIAGFHGQTLAHDPAGRGTHQIGDGAALARRLGMPVAWDFRSADIGAGGEGAPLAPFFHFACAKWIEAREPLAFLNLGGVGNVTWIDPSRDAPEEPGALLAFDTGPANAPIDDLVSARMDAPFDCGGLLAAGGSVDAALLERFRAHPYFARTPPKSLDRNAFRDLAEQTDALGEADAAATLTAMCVAGVQMGLERCPSPPARLLVAGGGRRNRAIMDMLVEVLDVPVEPVEAVGLDGDMMEAQAFAHLAVRVARGLPTSCPGTTGANAPVCGGRLSLPEEVSP